MSAHDGARPEGRMTTGTLARVTDLALICDISSDNLVPVHGVGWLDPEELVIVLAAITHRGDRYALSLVSSGEIGWILVASLRTVM